ncbi:aminoacyl-tRNA deacylase [candidate division KSB1 bacterium]
MKCCDKLKELLDGNNIKYMTLAHSKAYTAQEAAAAMHVSGTELAKSIIVRDNGRFSMVVLPASYQINFDMLKEALGKNTIQLATEKNFKTLFPEGCEVGAMCPFGNLYDIPVFLAQSIADHDEIIFKAGSHSHAVRMMMNNYRDLVNPELLKISEPAWPKRN